MMGRIKLPITPKRSTFQVNKRDHKIFTEDKRNLEARLDRTNFPHEPGPLFQESNITYEIAERTRAIGYGGIGAIHKLSCRLGLNRAIDRKIELLKLHAPYHESDHVLNIAYNVLSGGTCLEDIERLRNDETCMSALGAARILTRRLLVTSFVASKRPHGRGDRNLTVEKGEHRLLEFPFHILSD